MSFKNPLHFWTYFQVFSHVMVLVVGPWVILISLLRFWGDRPSHYLILSMHSHAMSLEDANLDIWHRVSVGLYSGWQYSTLDCFCFSIWKLITKTSKFILSHTHRDNKLIECFTPAGYWNGEGELKCNASFAEIFPWWDIFVKSLWRNTDFL